MKNTRVNKKKLHLIITDSEFDEEAAKKFLFDNYKGIDLLPGIPEKLTENDAAFVLNVSQQTVERLCEDGEIQLSKKSILNYIFRHFLYLAPLDL